MSDIIKLLPDSVANQIAAGEVIQRPASVVKELFENAVDAGAKSIQVIVKDAGRTLVQVVDDGCGMSDTDARLAFERHATSKISQAADLFSLHTMGFRGEALASIAAVAQIDLRTMQRGAEIGTRLIINGSAVESQTPEATVPGSNMMVKNLFYNVPARRKFLKKDAVEMSGIVREFERLALVNPGLDLTLINNDTVVHQIMAAPLKRRICDLFGKGLERQLIPVQTSTSLVSIDGFVGRPEGARRRNALQFLTVNGRHMRHPYFHKAVMTCYEQLLPAELQPNYFLNFTVDPATIDVNIHPTKNEIKFENEAAIWQILTAAVKEALGRFNAMPGIDFDAEEIPDIPVFDPNADASHHVTVDPGYNPFAESSDAPEGQESGRLAGAQPSFASRLSAEHRRNEALRDWDKLYEGFMGTEPDTTAVPSPGISGSRMNSEPYEPDALPFGSQADTRGAEDTESIQAKGAYILAPCISGVMVIDQHRAHVKVLYERYAAMLRNGDMTPQSLMFPEMLRLDRAQGILLSEMMPSLTEMGFVLEAAGTDCWNITGVPSVIDNVNPVEAISRILDDAADSGSVDTDGFSGRIALSMARSAAIRRGRRLSGAERENLLGELLKLPTPNYTPDGLAVIRVISGEELEEMFDKL
ncbi:MAG TPA: DNA mismatch repair endonuclease MutL [Porphyromonadaceae bacterium]|nr:DNA mismatch repair endonuclease MutL [Paramuribaculum sp.]HAB41225.1 DNA mismatch repair endonuclease MutL [Porphyromonadaceae bacterium]